MNIAFPLLLFLIFPLTVHFFNQWKLAASVWKHVNVVEAIYFYRNDILELVYLKYKSWLNLQKLTTILKTLDYIKEKQSKLTTPLSKAFCRICKSQRGTQHSAIRHFFTMSILNIFRVWYMAFSFLTATIHVLISLAMFARTNLRCCSVCSNTWKVSSYLMISFEVLINIRIRMLFKRVTWEYLAKSSLQNLHSAPVV